MKAMWLVLGLFNISAAINAFTLATAPGRPSVGVLFLTLLGFVNLLTLVYCLFMGLRKDDDDG